MNTYTTVLDNASAEATSSDRILQIASAAWRQGNFVEVVDQFNDQFTFTDPALGLEFKDKERSTEFLAKNVRTCSSGAILQMAVSGRRPHGRGVTLSGRSAGRR